MDVTWIWPAPASILPLMTEPNGGTLLRLAASTSDPTGGNPAGVWIGAALDPSVR